MFRRINSPQSFPCHKHPLDAYDKVSGERAQMPGLNPLSHYDHLPPKQVASLLMEQISLPSSLQLRPQDAALLKTAETQRFGAGFSRAAWFLGEGPLVILVHGWGGRASQMAPLAVRLAAAGYRSVVFDAGGHGVSRADPVGFDTFIEDVGDLCDFIGRYPFALIGHSAGALGMMASRPLRGVRASRYVCISAPLYPYVPIETVRALFQISDDVAVCLQPLFAAQFRAGWQYLQKGCAYQPEPGARLLLITDEDDDRVRHTDADFIAANWPGAEVLKTRGQGHNRILSHPLVGDRILELLET